MLLQQMIILFILMIVGYVSYKLEIITPEANKKLSSIVVNIASPALVLVGGMADERIEGKELLLLGILIVVIYAALMALAFVVPKILHIEKKSVGVYQNMTIFSNIGFMGFPIVSALYGSGAVLYAALFMIPYNLLIYTFGISVMTQEGAEKQKFSLKKVLNVGVISCVLALLFYLLAIPVPAFLKSALTHLSNLTAPLSMMVIGASMATYNLKTLFTDVKMLIFSVIKLLVIPVVGLLIIKQYISSEVICGVCMVMLATPVGSMTAMLAMEYDGDYELASRGVALTTLLSVITLPLVEMLV